MSHLRAEAQAHLARPGCTIDLVEARKKHAAAWAIGDAVAAQAWARLIWRLLRPGWPSVADQGALP